MPATVRSARRGVWVLFAAVLAVSLAGCSSPFERACPAVGWINTVEVRLDGTQSAIARVAWVELCDDAGCSTSDAPQAAPSVSPAPDPAPPYHHASPAGSARWSVNVMMATPENVTVSAYAIDSTLLGETSVLLTWTRVGGSEECGGPGAAEPVELRIAG